MTFKKGTLWKHLVKTTGLALAKGALAPVPTDYTFLDDAGVRFLVRALTNLSKKDEARRKQKTEPPAGETRNPFLSPEKDLIVADISDTHRAILNKYNVVEHHLLIITRRFEDQEFLLTVEDFEALLLCLAEYNGLGFYNAGQGAGASQPHKHLQLIPLPLTSAGTAVPIEPMLPHTPIHSVTMAPGLPFLHSFVRLNPSLVDTPFDAVEKIFALYSSMLINVGMAAPSSNRLTRQSMPYCFLMTREWMLLVPRSKEFFGDISLNSLAYAGSFFVRNEQELELLKTQGPMKALAGAALPKSI
jgi:ATP adenylyltransferase